MSKGIVHFITIYITGTIYTSENKES